MPHTSASPLIKNTTEGLEECQSCAPGPGGGGEARITAAEASRWSLQSDICWGGLVNICSHKDDNLISLQLKKKTLRITRNAASSVNVAEVVKDEAEEEEELRLPVWTRSCSPEGHPGYCYSSSLQKSPKRITHRCSRKSLNDDRE